MAWRGRGSCVAEVVVHRGEVLLIVPLTEAIGKVAPILVSAVSAFGVFHVGMLVDDGHHVGDGLGVAFKHLPP